MITVVELAGAGTETFFAVGVVYLGLLSITTAVATLIERNVAVPGLIHG
ncbi:MAG: hypothetical protein ACXQTN_04175 [Methanoculleaceae archaeon]